METINFIYKDRNFNSIHCLNTKKKHLYNGLYLYTAEITGNCYDAKNEILRNSYVPLLFNIMIIDYNYENIKNLTEIAKEYVSFQCEISVEKVNINFENDGSVSFIPFISVDDTLYNVYVGPNSKILNLCLSDFYSFKLIGTSPLTQYAHNVLNHKSILYNINGVYMLKNNLPQEILNLTRKINNLENNGYFYYEESIELDSLCKLWPIKKITNNIYQSNRFDSNWIDEALFNIKSGDLPIYTLTGDWMTQLERTTDNLLKLKYNCILAYIQLLVKNKILIDYILDLDINIDLSITGYFGTWIEVEMFKTLLNYNFEDYTILKYDNIEVAKQARNYLANNYSQYISLLLEYEDKYYVVINGAITNLAITNNHQISNNQLIYSGIISDEKSRGIISTPYIFSPELPGDIKTDENNTKVVIWNDKKLYLPNDKTNLEENWRNGDLITRWGYVKFLNKLSINEDDITKEL